MARLATEVHAVLTGPEDAAAVLRVELGEWQYEQLCGWSFDDLISLITEGTPGLPTTLEETQAWVNGWVASDSLREWAEGEGFEQDSLTRYLSN
jgi:hypothetical protein